MSRGSLMSLRGGGSIREMADDIFTEIQSIEAQADQILEEARQRQRAVLEEADAEVQRLQRAAEDAYAEKAREARRKLEEQLAEEKRRADEKHRALIHQLEEIHANRVTSLADWLIERLVDVAREH